MVSAFNGSSGIREEDCPWRTATTGIQPQTWPGSCPCGTQAQLHTHPSLTTLALEGAHVKNWTRCCVSISAFLFLSNLAAYAANSTSSSISLQATVPTTDNISCPGTTVTFSNMAYGAQNAQTQTVTCAVTTNDTNGVTMTVYTSTGSFMTGSGTNAIPASALQVYTTGSASGQNNLQAGYSALLPDSGWTGATSGSSGLDVATFADSDSNYSPVLNLQLTLPASTKADTYAGTLTVTITPKS